MQEGTVFVVIQFPQPWPMATAATLFTTILESSTVEIAALADGSLRLYVHDGSTIHADYTTQPIAITGSGYAILETVWQPTEASVLLNGKTLRGRNEAAGQVLSIETKAHIPEAQPSFLAPEAATVCRTWMAWRRHLYSAAKPSSKRGRRLKTLQEQLRELEAARTTLLDLVALLQQGRGHLLGHLATELRALVYWNGKNYNPLLLRLAGRLGLPLPVYFLKEDRPPGFIPEPNLRVRTGQPSIVRIVPTQQLADIQDWLTSNVWNRRFVKELEGSDINETDALTAKGVILSVATTLGSAHYDEDVSESLESLYQTKGAAADGLTLVLLEAAALVISLSSFVLSNGAAQSEA